MRTLAFPFTAAMAQPIWCYTFSPGLNDAWRDLTWRYTQQPQQLCYRDLTDAVRFVIRDYATIRKDPATGGTRSAGCLPPSSGNSPADTTNPSKASSSRW